MWTLRTLPFVLLPLFELIMADAVEVAHWPAVKTPKKRDLHPVTLPISINHSYKTVQLSLGTPPQPINFLFDTGSGPLWALNQKCALSCPNAYNTTRPFYDPGASSTSHSTSQRESIDYLGGIIAGDVWSDKLVIANVSAPFPLRVINANTSNWSSMPAGGFLGLAFPSIALGNTSIYDAIFHPSFIPDHRTGIYLGSAQDTDSNPSPRTNGVLTFGGSEEKIYGSEPLKWINVIPSSNGQFELWRVPMKAVKTIGVNSSGSAVGSFPVQEGSSAIFDTGAAPITVPESIIDKLYSALGFNYTAITQGYRPLCSDVIALNTSLVLTLGDAQITLKTADMAKPGYTEDQYCWPPFESWSSSNWLIGGTFLKSFYSVWDLGAWNVSEPSNGFSPRVGLAHLRSEYMPRVGSQ